MVVSRPEIPVLYFWNVRVRPEMFVSRNGVSLMAGLILVLFYCRLDGILHNQTVLYPKGSTPASHVLSTISVRYL